MSVEKPCKPSLKSLGKSDCAKKKEGEGKKAVLDILQ